MSDIILIRLPTPIGFFVFFLSKIKGKKIFIQIKGEWITTASEGNLYSGMKRKLAIFGSLFFHNLSRFMVKRATTLVHGSKAKEKYSKLNKNCYEISVSLIRNEDISLRKDSCNKEKIRLLFVGRISPAKGLRYLFEAISDINEYNIELDVVGMWRDERIREELENLTLKLNLEKKIKFLGHKTFGKKLFDIYKRVDIFILPSISEGIPKVLFEAMASGVPIVTTNVGGIPNIIKNKENGILIEPYNSEAIKNAIKELINDSVLRKKIIRNGYKTVRKYTIEKQAKKIAYIILNSSK